MALVIREEYQGEEIINTVRMGVIERIKKAGIKYTLDFYNEKTLYDLIVDSAVSLKEIKLRLQGREKEIIKGGILLTFSREAKFKTKCRKLPRPKKKVLTRK